MSIATTKATTIQEFFDFVHRPENRGRFFELERGEIIPMPPPTKYHGFVCANVGRILGNYAVQRGRGYLCGNDAGVIVEEAPDTVRGPDFSYFEDNQTAANMERGYATTPPLLSVDVLSPHDRHTRVAVRVSQLLNRGVQLVWIVDPEAREVCVYRQGCDPYVVTESQELTGEDVLPGFRCRVSDFFAMPGQAAGQTNPEDGASAAKREA